MSDQKREIVVEDVIEMLESGKTRKEIQAHYGLNGVELKTLFNHPDLKGRRTHKTRDFVIVTRAEQQAGGSNEGLIEEDGNTENTVEEIVDEGNDSSISNDNGTEENSNETVGFDSVQEAEVIEETTTTSDPHQDLHEENIDAEEAAHFGQL